MILSKRLETAISLAKRASHGDFAGQVAADIGCDHGYLAVELIRRSLYQRVYACDNKPGPLKKARQHLQEASLSSHVIPVLSDGFSRLPVEEIDTAFILGMGGRVMTRILEEAFGRSDFPRERMKLILGPQSELGLVLRLLYENGWRIFQEEIVLEEGHFYFLFQFRYLKESPLPPLYDFSAYYSPRLLTEKNPLYEAYLRQKAESLELLLQKESLPESRRSKLLGEKTFVLESLCQYRQEPHQERK